MKIDGAFHRPTCARGVRHLARSGRFLNHIMRRTNRLFHYKSSKARRIFGVGTVLLRTDLEISARSKRQLLSGEQRSQELGLGSAFPLPSP